MNEENRCPQCGVVLSAHAPQGLCPGCLLKRGLETHTYTEGGPEEAKKESAECAPPTPDEMAVLFPDLEILELVGRGGMGVVYKARQKRLDRVVALKILSPRLSRDPAFAARFAREARAMAMLSHPHVVAVYDFGEVDGLFYFLMEFVDGVNLRRLLDAGELAPEEALAIVPQICDALQYAHDHGVVHRDIKPENVLMDKEGRVKIADFGIAKLVGAEDRIRHVSSDKDDDTHREPVTNDLTAVGQVLGTPQYMAPEQIEHPLEVDHRADIYSLGVVFYQMLTGKLPTGRFIAPPSQKVQIDVRLDEVVLRAMEKEPERRYQQVSEVKTRVENIVTTPPERIMSHKPETESEDSIVHARQQVKGPAIGLLTTGIFTFLALLLLMLVLPLLSPLKLHGRPSLSLLIVLAFSSGFMIVSALKMRRLQSYGLTMTASILAIIFSPSTLIGLPIGIWALVVLSQREIRGAFTAVKSAEGSDISTSGQLRSVAIVIKYILGVLVLFMAATWTVMCPDIASVLQSPTTENIFRTDRVMAMATSLGLLSLGIGILLIRKKNALRVILSVTVVLLLLLCGTLFTNLWNISSVLRGIADLESDVQHVNQPTITEALEEYRKTLVVYHLGFDAVFPMRKWEHYDAERLEMYPNKDTWPKVLGHVDTNPDSFKIIRTNLQSTTVRSGPNAFLIPLEKSLVTEGYATLLFLQRISTEGTVVAKSYTSLVCFGEMQGRLNFDSYATALVKGDMSGRITSQSYFNLVVTGKFTGYLVSDSYAMIYLLGGCKGNLELNDSKVYIAGRTNEADLSRITGKGEVYLETSDLPPGEHKIRDLTVTVGNTPSPDIQPTGKIQPLDLLQIHSINMLLDHPIDGNYLVEPNGEVSLGPAYGRANVQGLTVKQAEQKIVQQLEKIVKDPSVQVVLGKRLTKWREAVFPRLPYAIEPKDVLSVKVQGTSDYPPIDGLFTVEPEGSIPLGPAYGRAQVSGLTLDAAEKAIEKNLQQILADPKVQVTLPHNFVDSPAVHWQDTETPKTSYTIQPGEPLFIDSINMLKDQPIQEVCLVEPAGTVALGPAYGRVKVQNLSLAEAEKAVTKKLKEILIDPAVSVTLAGWIDEDSHFRRGPLTRTQASPLTPPNKADSSQEQQQVPQQPSSELKKVDFVLGPQRFVEGENITIEEVRSELGTLAEGDTVRVKGTYTLASRPKATLGIGVTQRAGELSPTVIPIVHIQSGTDSFELKYYISCNGHLHVTFYPILGGDRFGTVYFGTESQMKEIAHWDLEARAKQASDESLPPTEAVDGSSVP